MSPPPMWVANPINQSTNRITIIVHNIADISLKRGRQHRPKMGQRGPNRLIQLEILQWLCQ